MKLTNLYINHDQANTPEINQVETTNQYLDKKNKMGGHPSSYNLKH